MSFAEFNATCTTHCYNNNTWNFSICTEMYYVDCAMYPKRLLELEYLVPMTVVLVLIFLSGLLGNLSVCTVILKHPNMRTDTNVYLFSLAVSDILLLVFGQLMWSAIISRMVLELPLVLISRDAAFLRIIAAKPSVRAFYTWSFPFTIFQGLAPELHYYWQMYPYVFGEFICRTTGFLASTGTLASALTVVAFSIERYTAICHHTRSRTRGNRRVAMAIVAIWTVSFAMSVPVFHVYHIVINEHLKYPPDSKTAQPSPLGQVCGKLEIPEYAYYDRLYWINSVVFFFVPMAILMLMYIKIALFIRSNGKLARDSGITNNCSENTKIFKVLAAVVLAFILCSAPFHYQRITAAYLTYKQNTTEKQEEKDIPTVEELNRGRILLVITGVFYYFSATINPILYNAMSKRYRTAFKEIFAFGSEKKEYVEIKAVPDSTKSSGKKSTTTATTLAS